MKKSLIILSTLLLSFTVGNDPVIERLGVTGPLTFNKTEFKLAWTSKPTDNYYIQEYLPDGESAETFTQMLSIFLLDDKTDAKEAVAHKVAELKERQKTDGVCKFMVLDSPDGKETTIDFLVGVSENDRMTVVEFNIYRYKQIELDKGRKALLIYAYSKRAYGDQIKPFFAALKADRTAHLKEMTALELPSIKLTGN